MMIRREKPTSPIPSRWRNLMNLQDSLKLMNKQEETEEIQSQREKYRERIGLRLLELAEQGKQHMLTTDYMQKLEEVKFLQEYQPKIFFNVGPKCRYGENYEDRGD